MIYGKSSNGIRVLTLLKGIKNYLQYEINDNDNNNNNNKLKDEKKLLQKLLLTLIRLN